MPNPSRPTSRPARARGPLVRAADALVGDRLRGGIDRRVRTQLGAAEGALAAALAGPHGQRLVEQEVRRQLAEHADREFTLSLLLGARVPSNRTLTPARHAALLAEIRALTGAGSVEWQVTQAYRSLLDAEARGLGRIAGSPYNILGKLVVPPLLAPPAGPVLEIGTLYGLFSPALIRSFRRAGQERHLTVVDPFAGLQIQNARSLPTDQTGTPVTEHTARRNFAEFGLAEDEVRVVVGLSTDPAVRATAGDRKYAVVIVDGDHGQEGVAADLEWLDTVLAPGGIAVLDDFGDGRWPGVEAATRAYLAGGGRAQLVGTVSTSAYLRMPVD